MILLIMMLSSLMNLLVVTELRRLYHIEGGK